MEENKRDISEKWIWKYRLFFCFSSFFSFKILLDKIFHGGILFYFKSIYTVLNIFIVIFFVFFMLFSVKKNVMFFTRRNALIILFKYILYSFLLYVSAIIWYLVLLEKYWPIGKIKGDFDAPFIFAFLGFNDYVPFVYIGTIFFVSIFGIFLSYYNNNFFKKGEDLYKYKEKVYILFFFIFLSPDLIFFRNDSIPMTFLSTVYKIISIFCDNFFS